MNSELIQGRLAHLQNKLAAIRKSIAIYGHEMPDAHHEYKVTGMIPDVEHAIRKILDNPKQYGVCEECEEPIFIGRLMRLPECRLCTACQSKKERRRK